MKAIGYCRVSSEKQVQEGLSLETQKERLQAWATMRGAKLVDIVIDKGISGGTLDRPGLWTILNKLNELDALVVTQLDRLTRSVRDLGEVLELLDEHRVSLVSLSEGVDATSAGGRLILNMLGSVSQWQREDVGEKTRIVLDRKRQMGEHVGRVPFGFRIGKTGQLEEYPDEFEIIRSIKRLRRRDAKRWSYSRIAGRYGLSIGLVHRLIRTDLRRIRSRNT